MANRAPTHPCLAEIFDRYEGGAGAVELAQEYDISASTLSHWLHRAGIQRTRQEAEAMRSWRVRTKQHHRCCSCKRQRPIAEFLPSQKSGACIECRQKRYARDRDKYLAANRWAKYGLDDAGYQALLDQQDRTCALCNSRGPLCIDHDHSTGEVRGLLCHRCNGALGKLGDSSWAIERVLRYLGGGVFQSNAGDVLK